MANQTTAFSDRLLGKAISKAEYAHENGRALDEPLWAMLPETTQVIGITGPPGAGKSTLTDKLIVTARAEGLRVGVLAVDPSSPFTGGAILGDRVRMARHAADPSVFIRSMGSRASHGGLAASTRSAVRLLANSGADIVIIETVGVGQAELDIMHVADTVVVVVVPGLGDTVQMNKAGILEIGDVFVVNQSDRPEAQRTKLDLEQAIMLGHRNDEMPTVTLTQATIGEGVEELWRQIRKHIQMRVDTGALAARRLAAQRHEICDQIKKTIVRNLNNWLSSGEFQSLLDSRSPSAWNVHDLANHAADVFLGRPGPRLGCGTRQTDREETR